MHSDLKSPLIKAVLTMKTECSVDSLGLWTFLMNYISYRLSSRVHAAQFMLERIKECCVIFGAANNITICCVLRTKDGTIGNYFKTNNSNALTLTYTRTKRQRFASYKINSLVETSNSKRNWMKANAVSGKEKREFALKTKRTQFKTFASNCNCSIVWAQAFRIPTPNALRSV